MNRRTFLGAAAGMAIRSAQAQTSEWGAPVIDIHLHMRRDLRQSPQEDIDANIKHIDGCGVQKAILLARSDGYERVKPVMAKYPGRFVWSAATDITQPEAEGTLRSAVKQGAIGLGELKAHVAANGPELRRLYSLAAEMNVPILVHFQEVPHFEGEGVFATGFKNFEAVLKAYPKTKFVGHADAFWANVDAKYANEAAYPTGPVTKGGVTDKLLGDYPNLFGDLSANSGNNALSRDAEFTAGFLKRHQDKLMFGSDCSCADGKGSGIGQRNNPAAARLAGQCVARATLKVLKGATTPEVFRKLVWANAHRVYGIPA
ncbi:MAG: amidohydrolase [Bryobacteraceae bacterium]|nr:amidohydrolase [Bryobacteraceae bacterium]